MTEAEVVASILRHCAGERCRLAQAQTYPPTPRVSLAIETNERLERQARGRLGEIQQKERSNGQT